MNKAKDIPIIKKNPKTLSEGYGEAAAQHKALDKRKSLYDRYSAMNRSEQRKFKAFCEDIGIKGRTFYNYIQGITEGGPLLKTALAGYFQTTLNMIWFEVKKEKV
jgi:hypothetical protein